MQFYYPFISRTKCGCSCLKIALDRTVYSVVWFVPKTETQAVRGVGQWGDETYVHACEACAADCSGKDCLRRPQGVAVPHFHAAIAPERWCQCSAVQRLFLLQSMGSRVCQLQQLHHVFSVVAVHGLSCFVAHAIFLDQGSNPCPLHWQADS